ncbi:MAG: ABC transporter substrate-binding protein [Flavisolibacter sp.]
MLSSCYNGFKDKKLIFHYNEQTGIASLDPAFAKNQSVIWAVHQLYNTLIETDSVVNLVPSLAKKWEISADRKSFTFILRSDVLFHDDPCFVGGRGRKMVASDVVYSLQRIIKPQTASPGAWIFNGKLRPLGGLVALNDTVFQMNLNRPFHPILGILSMQYCCVVPHEAVELYGADFRRHPVGTGPFQCVAWEEGQALLMKKNRNYFEIDKQGKTLPYLDGIKVSFYDSKASEFLLFRQKKLEFINDIDPSFKDEILTKNGKLRKNWSGQIQLQKHPYLNTEYFGILVDPSSPLVNTSPLRLKKIRQAINYGFDRKKMILYLRNSIGVPASAGFIPRGLPSFDSALVKGYDYQPALARAYLKEVGLGQDTLPSLTLITVATFADFGSFVAKQLEEVGFTVQVEIVQKSLLFEMTSSGKALFFRGSWIADYPDAENYLSVFYSKNPAPPNYTRFKNAVFDSLYEQAVSEENDSLRYSLYRQADRVVVEQAPVVPLWYDEVVRFVQPYVEGFQPNALNLLELKKVHYKTK